MEEGTYENQRFDIFGRVPHEIAWLIIDDYFDQRSITPYSCVSSAWRAVIINPSKLWKKMVFGWNTIAITTGKEGVISPYKLLPSTCQYVQELEIRDELLLLKLFGLFLTKNFSKIQSVKIKGFKLPGSPVSYAPFSSALSILAKTLTILDLSLASNSTNLPKLSDILNICSSLAMLRYVVRSGDPIFIPIRIAAQHETMMLKKLVLSSACEHDKMHPTELQKLLKHSPYLSFLTLGNCDDSIYTAVEKYGQNITSLHINHYGPPYSVWFNKDLSDNCDSILSDYNSPGLKHSSVNGIASPCSFLSLIKEHHRTLSSLLFLLQSETRHNFNEWDRLTDVLSFLPFPNLTHIHLQDSAENSTFVCTYILPAIITTMNNVNNQQKTPNLQCLELYIPDRIPNNIMDAIAIMPRLTELELMYCSFDPNKMLEMLKIFERSNNSAIITAPTTRATTLSSSVSLLTKLKLRWNENILNDNIVLTASKIKSLIRLTIDYPDARDIIYKTFVQNVSQLPLLQYLEIAQMQMTMDD